MKVLFSILFGLGIYTGASSQTYLPLTGGTLTGGLTGTSATFTGNIYSNYSSSSQIAFVAAGANYASITDKDLFRRIWFETTGGYRTLLDIPANGSLQMRNSNGGVLSTFLENGNVGIGTTTPAYKLEVDGIIKSTTKFLVPSGMFGLEVDNPTGLYFNINELNTKSGPLWLAYRGEKSVNIGTLIHLNATAGQDSYFNSGGNFGIGTASPSEKLSVNGKIRAKEVKVEASGWPDFVFEPAYKLPDLSQTEAFIKQNKHLPAIPSAKEVEKNGINLGEMNAKLLQKIEELTLYLIDLKKGYERLSKEMAELAPSLTGLNNTIRQQQVEIEYLKLNQP